MKLKRAALVGGPLLAGVIYLTMRSQGLEPGASWTAAITALCAAWWVFEPIPMP
jgi:sodium-dependent dicarboxylate transporter 2/3/5